MIELQGIVKRYVLGGETVLALAGMLGVNGGCGGDRGKEPESSFWSSEEEEEEEGEDEERALRRRLKAIDEAIRLGRATGFLQG